MSMISVLGLEDKASVAHVYLWYVWRNFSNTFSLGKAVLSPSFNLAVLAGRYVHKVFGSLSGLLSTCASRGNNQVLKTKAAR